VSRFSPGLVVGRFSLAIGVLYYDNGAVADDGSVALCMGVDFFGWV
jgi:hypothetical protein